VPGEVVVDDLAPEGLVQVEGEVRNAHAVREGARAGHGLGRAAALRAVVGGVGPELERDGDDVVAALAAEVGRDRAVDAAGHRDERPAAPGGRGEGDARVSRRDAERPVQRVGGQLRRVPALRRESPQFLAEQFGRQPRGGERRTVAHHLHHDAPRGARGGAAVGVEARLGDDPVAQLEADVDEVAAGRAAGAAAVLRIRQAAATARCREVVLE
jgi:hypothetical protein